MRPGDVRSCASGGTFVLGETWSRQQVASLMRSQVPLAGAVGVLLGSYIYKGIATQPGDQQTRTQTDTDEVYGESPVKAPWIVGGITGSP